jgi:hypothetical protein
MLRAGFVGLPNVGKSTLFNAMTRSRKAEAANYPFCTIEPNVGIVTVPDERLDVLAKISNTQKIVPAVIEVVDIAGLVKGASQGEGLGNQFLSHIREVDAIVQVVRCFDDENIHHVSGSVDPLRDIEVIMMELIFADIASVQKRLERIQKTNKLGKDKEAAAEAALLQKLEPHLNAGKPALSFEVNEEEAKLMKGFFLLSSKPTLYACNVKEEDLGGLENNNRSTPTGQRVKAVEDYAKNHLSSQAVVISAKIEEDLMDLSPEEQKEYLQGLGVQESGVGQLIKKTYSLLGLETYLTTGEKETRAWTIHKGFTAPQAAGVIHGDFERGFIAAECMAYDDIVKYGTIAKVKEAGRLRMEGKGYIVQDGDVMEFRFNVSK